MGNLDFRCQIADYRQLFSWFKNLSFFGIWLLVIGICLTSCVTQPSRIYTQSTVTAYAELTLLYEKEKMEKKQTDSSYQIIVNDFFATKGLKQEEFKKQIDELSKNTEVWKLFVQDVSSTMDSLKIVQQ